MRTTTLALFVACLLPVATLSCSDDSPAGTGGDGDAALVDTGPDDPLTDVVVPPDGSSSDGTDGVNEAEDPDPDAVADVEDDGDPNLSDPEPGELGDDCVGAADCAAPLVCAPGVNECTDDLGCVAHADCGVAAFCDDGTCAPSNEGGPCDSTDNCIEGELCAGDRCVDAGCDALFFSAEAVPSNLLIVFDRSGSMNNGIGGGGGSKWDIGRAAIDTVVQNFAGQIYFGLNLFPGLDQACDEGADCGPGAVNVGVGLDTGGAIATFLEGADTCSFGTPISAALTELLDYEGLEDAERANYVLLVTDGMESCSDDPAAAVTALRNEVPEIRTYVVGFGGAVDEAELEALAEAGGTWRPGPDPYYQADDPDALADAFASIAGSVLGCEYELSEAPVIPDLLYIYQDEVEVPRDTNQVEGWEYNEDGRRVTFYGEACDTLRTGMVDELLIVYGCPIGPKD